MITLDKISYSINDRLIFSELSCTFLPSAIIHIQGVNGSGKTSLLRMIAGIQTPTSGNIIKSKYMQSCTYIGHNLGVKLEMTALENIKMWAEVYDGMIAVDAAVHYLDLDGILDKKCYQLSVGNQKKIALSKLIICQSNLWLLDEADANLDQHNRSLLYGIIITKANNGGIILATSHWDFGIPSAQSINLKC